MLRYYRFNADLPHPAPARPTNVKRPKGGSGWPEHCPPIRAANAYGWDVINPFEMRFTRDADGEWDLDETVEVHSDIDLDEGGEVSPHPQLNAWFWEQGQTRPHVITDEVYLAIRHQVKVSTFLYLQTDEDELLWIRGVPNRRRDWSVIESIVETDWYAPAHPWHTVIELPRIEESPIDEVVIPEGERLCRLVPLRRDAFEAVEMSAADFGALFAEGQKWLMAHGRDLLHGDDLDITGQYAKQQRQPKFTVAPDTDAKA
ncbi:MAG: hypothetical protein ACF8PN_04520 [Phycisphaerales bacterium]